MPPVLNYRVAIIEDDAVVRGRIAEMIAASDRYRLVWMAEDIETAQIMMGTLCDVVLLDLGLPDGRGTCLIAPLRARMPQVRIVAFTVFDDEVNVIEAIEAGVDGYALKAGSAEDLIDALDSASRGDFPISPAVAGYLFKRLRRRERAAVRGGIAHDDPPMALTPRERDVLAVLAKGVSYREAAETLGIGINTLSHHIKNLYPKLAATSRSEAVYRAVREGILRLDA
ncbi:MAG TPA: response regulator transcription factor [Pseudomonadota bacterium]|jgi:DNA-binding NarL/FixJ family response regulator|nr:response regulator transcription factor [Pseudomonadota bacterium]